MIEVFVICRSGWFWKWESRNKAPYNHLINSFWKSNCPEVHCRSLDSCSSQMINHQLRHKRFDQISGHKHDIYLNGKLFTKQLAQAAYKNTSSYIYSDLGQLYNIPSQTQTFIPTIPFLTACLTNTGTKVWV